MNKNLFVILGNQLFDPQYLKDNSCSEVYMSEKIGLSKYVKYHKLKIYLFLCAMREYRDELEKNGIKVYYFSFDKRKTDETYFNLLKIFIDGKNISKLNFFEIEDKGFEKDFLNQLNFNKIDYKIHQSPMFIFSRKEFREFSEEKKVFRMSSFYTYGRKKFNILIDEEKKPIGGKWSFDMENRKKIPQNLKIPNHPQFKKSIYHDAVCKIINENFSSCPGEINTIWFPVSRNDTEIYLDSFLRESLKNFGVYEDAMVQGKNFLFHSCLSAFLNIGLLTPSYLIRRIINYSEENLIPINSLEGFIRQVLGWREFIRGIYQAKGDFQVKQNYWKHENKLSSSWYNASTGIFPLDDSINKAIKHGYNHHIPRLMVISNIMNLCEINPKEIYKWFMEMYIDSSDWVMVPNVFGMATYADGGLMSTKPYTCGSNYILKMSNYKKGEWCDIVDGLYWRFTKKNLDFYKSNSRLSFLHRTLDRMSNERKSYIFKKAEEFIGYNTQ